MLIRTPHGAFIDPVRRALAQIGVNSRLRAPGRPEEFAGPAVGGSSTGIVEAEASPVRWINVQANLSYQSGRPDWFMLLYGIPDQRITSGFEGIEVGIDSRRLIGPGTWQVKTGWRVRTNRSFARAIARSLNGHRRLNGLLAGTSTRLTVVADPIVESWIVATPAAGKIEEVLPSRDLMDMLRLLGTELLQMEVPGDLRAIRISGRNAPRVDPELQPISEEPSPRPKPESRDSVFRRRFGTATLAERASQLPTRVASSVSGTAARARDTQIREAPQIEQYTDASYRSRARQDRPGGGAVRLMIGIVVIALAVTWFLLR